MAINYYEKRRVGKVKEVMYELIKGPKENTERGSPYCQKDEFLVLRLEKDERDPEKDEEWWTAYDSAILGDQGDQSLYLRQPVWCSKEKILEPGEHVWQWNKLASSRAQESVRARWTGGFLCETRVIDEMSEGTTSQLEGAERVQ